MNLNNLINAGVIWWCENENQYVGLAFDKVEVLLGNTKEQVEKYLIEVGGPENW